VFPTRSGTPRRQENVGNRWCAIGRRDSTLIKKVYGHALPSGMRAALRVIDGGAAQRSRRSLVNAEKERESS
jgi:hypothetical protein